MNKHVRRVIKSFESKHPGLTITSNGIEKKNEAKQQKIWKNDDMVARIEDIVWSLPLIMKPHKSNSRGSYGLNHTVERHPRLRLYRARFGHGHVANGRFIIAALILGWKYKKLSKSQEHVSPNLSFKVMCFSEFASSRRQQQEKDDALKQYEKTIWSFKRELIKRYTVLNRDCISAIKACLIGDEVVSVPYDGYHAASNNAKASSVRYKPY